MSINFTSRDRRIAGNITSALMSLAIIILFISHKFSQLSHSLTTPVNKVLTPLAQDILSFERSHQSLSIYILGATIFCLMFYLFIFTTRRTLYPQGIYLQPIIYSALAVAISSMAASPLIAAATMLLSIMITTEICSVNHTSYAASIYSDTPISFKSPTSRLLAGALYMGLLSLIQPSALILVMTIPIIIFCFDRYIYELFIPMIAFFAPMGIELYIRWWLYDANVDLLIDRYWAMFSVDGSIFTSWSSYTTLLQSSYATTFLVIFSLILSGLGLARILNYSITARAHQRFVYCVVLFIVGIFMTMLSSFAIDVLLIIAAPVAILITAALINLRVWVSVAIFLLYLLLTLVAIFN
ncbi:MAG: hypothetical protein SNJ09_08770 [Rikenellaceae bacterium]